MTSLLQSRHIDQSFVEMNGQSQRVTRSSKRAITFPVEEPGAPKRPRTLESGADVAVDSLKDSASQSPLGPTIIIKKSSSRPQRKARNPRRTGPNSVEKHAVETKATTFVKGGDSKTEVSITVVECAPTQQALVVASKGTYALIDDHPLSPTSSKEVRIKTHAVGLNPIDWKSVDYNFCLPEFPWVTGREMAGVVEEVGNDVTDWKIGDRVWTSTYYRDSRAGCFQEFVTVPQHTISHIPKNLDFKSAACLGVAALTAAMTLWKWLGVPMNADKATNISEEKNLEQNFLLVWGGSTITGQFAIQFAVKAGIRVIAVTSDKTKQLAKELGAEVVSRDAKTDEEVVAAVREIGGDHITRCIDLVGPKTAALCLSTFSARLPVTFAPLAMMSSSQVVPENVIVETVEMKQFVLDEASQVYSNELNKQIESGDIRLPEIEVMTGGFSVVKCGLDRIKKGDMRGKKVVVSIL